MHSVESNKDSNVKVNYFLNITFIVMSYYNTIISYLTIKKLGDGDGDSQELCEIDWQVFVFV